MDLFAAFKRQKEIDSSRTLDTLMEEGRDISLSMEEEPSLALPRSKSPNFSPRRSKTTANEQLREIQERCSYPCFAFVANLVAEFK
jgi:hypothetical protein